MVAAIAIIPGAGDAAGKAIKAAEKALTKGDVTEASRLINKASDEIKVKWIDENAEKNASARKGTSANNPLGLGSTGRNTPANLNEKLALEQAISNPNSGRQLPVPMTDKRWPASDGWVKMSQNINGIEVHYVRNTDRSY
ncbi:hypothetical protein [Photorhabdus tasmaniensis]|uniref:hypothetical protein n=1 Tax=Photorhabdus tasmaniensis TaxID=1004159 RepID=UPI0010E92832|nr:hypothetical protein [Photorhabdus tasmaniensis]